MVVRAVGERTLVVSALVNTPSEAQLVRQAVLQVLLVLAVAMNTQLFAALVSTQVVVQVLAPLALPPNIVNPVLTAPAAVVITFTEVVEDGPFVTDALQVTTAPMATTLYRLAPLAHTLRVLTQVFQPVPVASIALIPLKTMQKTVLLASIRMVEVPALARWLARAINRTVAVSRLAATVNMPILVKQVAQAVQLASSVQDKFLFPHLAQKALTQLEVHLHALLALIEGHAP